MPAGAVLAAGLFALVLAALLNADALVRDAEAKELDTPGRDVSLAVWRPVQRIAGLLQLTAPRELGDVALGREFDADGEFELPEVESVSSAEPEAVEEVAEPVVEVPEWRVPTVDDPLRVWVGGDSMSQVFGESVVRIGTDLRVIETAQDTHISTGLSRPDFYDWPARLAEVVDGQDPDVMLIMFGANDAQGLSAADGTFSFGEEGWTREYRRRVGATMDFLTADPDRLVVWVGQPSARDSAFAGRMDLVNGIFQEEAGQRERVVYLDTWDLLNTPGGEFSAVLAGDSGEMVSMRQGDGFHLTRPAGDRVAIAALREISSRFDLTAGSGGVTALSAPD